MYRVSNYIITLTSSVNSFTEQQATLVSELGYHVSIHFKRVEFELSMYIYIERDRDRDRKRGRDGQSQREGAKLSDVQCKILATPLSKVPST